MTFHTWLQTAEQDLAESGIGTARLDAQLLLEFVTERDRATILAYPEETIQPKQLKKLRKLLSRRMRHEPIAYIRGFTEFFGHTFVITPSVLEPRPESETMLELLINLINDGDSGLNGTESLKIADVGTGSGAIGICAKIMLPNARLELLDIDESACRVARRNVDLFTLNISVIQSDLLSNASEGTGILLCNLPYVPNKYYINEAAKLEPKIAIFGGPDGLDVYRRLFNQAAEKPLKPLYIFTESLPPQHDSLINIATSKHYEKVMEDDFIMVFKHSAPKT